jgi:TusA-related sulfurtransferase
MTPRGLEDGPDSVLDTRGSLCPQPIIDLSRRIRSVAVGSRVVVVSDDAAFPYDLRAWCEGTGHELVECATEGRVHTGIVLKSHD